jgi:hypothetical protein
VVEKVRLDLDAKEKEKNRAEEELSQFKEKFEESNAEKKELKKTIAGKCVLNNSNIQI